MDFAGERCCLKTAKPDSGWRDWEIGALLAADTIGDGDAGGDRRKRVEVEEVVVDLISERRFFRRCERERWNSKSHLLRSFFDGGCRWHICPELSCIMNEFTILAAFDLTVEIEVRVIISSGLGGTFDEALEFGGRMWKPSLVSTQSTSMSSSCWINSN